MTRRERNRRLIDAMSRHGIVYPRVTLQMARKVNKEIGHMPLSRACALLEKESGGGANVWGHDRDRGGCIPPCGGPVTRANYAAYLERRRRDRRQQGCGPTQLTYHTLQDRADRLGGCWRPKVNMYVGFSHLAENIKRNGVHAGMRIYNGSGRAAENYATDLRTREARWLRILKDALAGGQAPEPAARGPKPTARPRKPAARPRTELGGAGRARRPAKGAPKLDSGELLARLERLDVRGDRVREALIARGRRLEHALARERRLYAEVQRKLDAIAGDGALASAAAAPVATRQPVSLLEDLLVKVRSDVRRELELEREQRMSVDAELRALIGAPAPAAAAGPSVDPAGEATNGHASAVAVAPKPPAAPPAGPDTAPGSAATPPAGGKGGPKEPSLAELITRLERLDGRDERVRALLAARFGELERKVVRARRRRRKAEARLRGALGLPSAPGPRPGRPKPRGAAAVVVTRIGDSGPVVRQSKVALVRYLRERRPDSTLKLRRALMREVRSPRRAKVATETWRRAVRSAQKVAGHPITGRLDGELHLVLRPHWPRDSVVRRMARSTPAWRLVPGQLTRNFNVRELACKDGTPYVTGLMRERGLSKQAARKRAKGLAKRLEAVRRKGGGRPLHVTSAYRTKRYNASLPGAATNSAHTRGFAVDLPPPRGVSLQAHQAHVRASFECGVGRYSTFVHGDFDPTLGRRSWNG